MKRANIDRLASLENPPQHPYVYPPMIWPPFAPKPEGWEEAEGPRVRIIHDIVEPREEPNEDR